MHTHLKFTSSSLNEESSSNRSKFSLEKSKDMSISHYCSIETHL